MACSGGSMRLPRQPITPRRRRKSRSGRNFSAIRACRQPLGDRVRAATSRNAPLAMAARGPAGLAVAPCAATPLRFGTWPGVASTSGTGGRLRWKPRSSCPLLQPMRWLAIGRAFCANSGPIRPSWRRFRPPLPSGRRFQKPPSPRRLPPTCAPSSLRPRVLMPGSRGTSARSSRRGQRLSHFHGQGRLRALPCRLAFHR